MQIRTGQKRVKLPPIGQLTGLAVRARDDVGPMMAMTLGPYSKEFLEADDRGTPLCAALEHTADGSVLHIRPIPDAMMDLNVRYFPPIKEL